MLFCVVAHDVELVSELREIGLNSFSDLAKRLIEWFPILLIEAIRHLESDVCTLKQIQLHFGTQISLIPDDCALEEILSDIIHILEVMDAGLCQIIGVNHT